MAALRELDIRSRYSGDEATGTITDAMVVAETNRGVPILYGGPASPLGQLVGCCTRKAVKEAVMKGKECMPCRSIFDRLSERHLSMAKIASELSKVKSLGLDEKTLESGLTTLLKTEPFYASIVMAAIELDEDLAKGLVPPEFGDSSLVSKRFGAALLSTKNLNNLVPSKNYDYVGLPHFLKQVVISIIKSNIFEKTNKE